MKRRPNSPPMRAVSLIEPLEDRIAPAAVTIAPNGKMASYVDSNGDTVHVSTTKGSFTYTAGSTTSSPEFQFNDATDSGQLTALVLTGDTSFSGSAISFTVTPRSGGSTSVNVGYIDAAGLSLASVTVPGDLGRIDVGGGSSSLALGKLTVHSLCNLSDTQGTNGSGNSLFSSTSNITGSVGTVSVAGNLDGLLFVQDFNSRPGTGSIQHLVVGGSLDGSGSTSAVSTDPSPGDVFFTGSLGTAIIHGGIAGGSAAFSGSIGGYSADFDGQGNLQVNGLAVSAKIGSVSVLGNVPDDQNPSPLPGVISTSIFGGSGSYSGGVIASTISSVHVAGDIAGATGGASGFIQAGTSLGTVVVGGNLIGGNAYVGSTSAADFSGLIFGGTIGSVTIGKNIEGGSGIQSASIYSTGTIHSVTVGGDIIGGAAGDSSTSGISGGVRGHVIGSVVVDGSLVGGNIGPDAPVEAASLSGFIASDTSIGSVFIGKTMTGGSGSTSGVIQAEAGSIGSVTIGKDAGTSADPSIAGGAGSFSGRISATTTIGSISLAHGLTGGSGASSGFITSQGALSSLSIGGDIIGGTGSNSGEVSTSGLLKSLKVEGSVTGAAGANSGYIDAQDGVTSLSIKGSLTGGGGAGSGEIFVTGTLHSAAILGSVTGGAGASSGFIDVAGPIDSLAIGSSSIADSGSVLGGSGSGSGAIDANGLIGKISLLGALTGGPGASSGMIGSGVGINTLVIGGNVNGGTANSTGDILVNGLLKNASIHGSIVGGNSGSAALVNSAYIQANSIGTLAVGGALISGTVDTGGSLDTSGAIRSNTSIGSISLGSIVGNSTNPAIISAVGQANVAFNATTDIAIGSVTVKGNTAWGDILAGYNTDTQNGSQPLGTGVNASAQIGTVTFDGTFQTTNVIAGVGPGANGFGTSSSAQLSGANVTDFPAIVSKISEIIIKGNLVAPPSSSETFGIAAQYVGSASIPFAASHFALIPGADNDTFAAMASHPLGAGIYLYEV